MRNSAAFVAALICCLPAFSQSVVVVKAARLFDGRSDSIVQPGLVVISGNKITAIGGAVPPGAKVIDLGDATLLPGFIDSHTHLSMAFNPDYNGARLQELQRPATYYAIMATVNAKKTLMAGFTTVRDVGSSDFIDVGLRDSINSGAIPGPRMLVSVHALGQPAAIATKAPAFGKAYSITRAVRRMGLLIHRMKHALPFAGISNTVRM